MAEIIRQQPDPRRAVLEQKKRDIYLNLHSTTTEDAIGLLSKIILALENTSQIQQNVLIPLSDDNLGHERVLRNLEVERYPFLNWWKTANSDLFKNKAFRFPNDPYGTIYGHLDVDTILLPTILPGVDVKYTRNPNTTRFQAAIVIRPLP